MSNDTDTDDAFPTEHDPESGSEPGDDERVPLGEELGSDVDRLGLDVTTELLPQRNPLVVSRLRARLRIGVVLGRERVVGVRVVTHETVSNTSNEGTFTDILSPLGPPTHTPGIRRREGVSVV